VRDSSSSAIPAAAGRTPRNDTQDGFQHSAFCILHFAFCLLDFLSCHEVFEAFARADKFPVPAVHKEFRGVEPGSFLSVN
jgi:hypothetical protein